MADVNESWDDYYPDFDDETSSIVLYEISDPTRSDPAALRTFKTNDGGLVYYDDNPSGFTVVVERILQVDGFESEDSTTQQQMTLFVLKLILASNDASKNIGQVRFSMVFKDKKDKKLGKKAEPTIIAWAPFESMERSNETIVKIDETLSAKAKGGGEGAGASAEASLKYKKKISWTTTYFDSGHAFPMMDKESQRPNGVRWVLTSNQKKMGGVIPEITVAMLLSRSTDEPYVAEFDIKLRGGLLYNLARRLEALVGHESGRTQHYAIPVSEKPITRGEGEFLLGGSQIDPRNLGRLRAEGALSNLTFVWRGKDELEVEGQRM